MEVSIHKKNTKEVGREESCIMFQESTASLASIDCCKLGCLQKFSKSLIHIIHAETSQYDF
jgi:hypothetical protein